MLEEDKPWLRLEQLLTFYKDAPHKSSYFNVQKADMWGTINAVNKTTPTNRYMWPIRLIFISFHDKTGLFAEINLVPHMQRELVSPSNMLSSANLAFSTIIVPGEENILSSFHLSDHWEVQ